LKTIVNYYKGNLKSQFSTTKGEKLGNTVDMQSKYILEPRFRLYDAEEIKEEEYPKYDDYKSTPFVLHEEVSDVEFYFKKPSSIEKRIKTASILLLLQKDENIISNSEGNSKLKSWTEYVPEEKGHSFLAFKEGINHGKIEGIGYCKVEKTIDENGIEILNPIKLNPSKLTTSEKNGCLGFLVSIFKPVFATIFAFNTWLKNKLNYLSNGLFKNNLINDVPVNSGCLNPMLPSGCTSSGCSNFGCGCLSLLLAIAFLAWLIWCVILGKCDKSNQQKMDNNKVIHDTVYVEVYKEKVDTLTIVKIDTLTYVDKTTKTNYEMVSLPNVQFKTNEDVLLPSSAKDLQKLAEYLIKNNDMNAEIIGHTDNVGKPESNKTLSKQRAESIKRFLVSLGVNGSRLNAIGMGDTQPKSSNDSEEGRLMNRRVEVKLSKTEKIETEREKVDTKTPKLKPAKTKTP
jgi:outer membrane protein OmpA-like peptidoglycan-associated protein